MTVVSVRSAFHSDVTSNGVDARVPRNAVASVQVRYRLHAQWGDSHVTAHLRLAVYRRCSPALVLINGDTYPRPKSSVALTRVTNLSGQCLKSRWVAGLYHTVFSAESWITTCSCFGRQARSSRTHHERVPFALPNWTKVPVKPVQGLADYVVSRCDRQNAV
jgi:hypothetical protein